jgi:hypothetical protein
LDLGPFWNAKAPYRAVVRIVTFLNHAQIAFRVSGHSLRGRPRGRIVDCKPKRFATASTQRRPNHTGDPMPANDALRPTPLPFAPTLQSGTLASAFAGLAEMLQCWHSGPPSAATGAVCPVWSHAARRRDKKRLLARRAVLQVCRFTSWQDSHKPKRYRFALDLRTTPLGIHCSPLASRGTVG